MEKEEDVDLFLLVSESGLFSFEASPVSQTSRHEFQTCITCHSHKMRQSFLTLLMKISQNLLQFVDVLLWNINLQKLTICSNKLFRFWLIAAKCHLTFICFPSVKYQDQSNICNVIKNKTAVKLKRDQTRYFKQQNTYLMIAPICFLNVVCE